MTTPFPRGRELVLPLFSVRNVKRFISNLFMTGTSMSAAMQTWIDSLNRSNMRHHRKSEVELQVLTELCRRIGSCFALKVKILVEASDFRQLADARIDPNCYLNAHDFALDYLLVNFLSKWKGLKTGIDTRKRALEGWTASELLCRQTNQVFRRQLRGFTPRVESVLFLAQRKIAAVLGPLKSFDMLEKCKWSNGATYDLKRGVTFARKMSGPISVTKDAACYLQHVLEADPHWFGALYGVVPEGPFSLLTRTVFSYVRGSRFLTVPKSAKTDRCISAEPTGNAFLQQGIHAHMRNRLKRFGVDLSNQSRSQVAAASSQKDGNATIDLSSASDSISSLLVADLLPGDWYLLLDSLRSKESFVEGSWVRLEKFSSMGNAFTFELETLIFWALMSSVNEIVGRGVLDTCLVYGDDIIIPETSVPLAFEVLSACGFLVNQSKSFWTGRFRESCGGHYFDGYEVTPAYQKELTDKREELIRMYNRLVRWSQRLYGFPYSRVILSSLDVILSEYRKFNDPRLPRIPHSCTDDDGFLSDSRLLGSHDINHGYLCTVYRAQQRFKRVNGSHFLAYKFRNPSLSSSDSKGQGWLGTAGNYRYGKTYRHDWNAVG